MLHVDERMFQTAWFVQSIATQVLVVVAIRTVQLAWRDRPAHLATAEALERRLRAPGRTNHRRARSRR